MNEQRTYWQRAAMFFAFPDYARWNGALSAVKYGAKIGEYAAVVGVLRRVFRGLLAERPTPEKCVQDYYLHRTRLERIAGRKLRRRQLTDEENVKIACYDLREGRPR